MSVSKGMPYCESCWKGNSSAQRKSENENNLNEVVACRPCVRGRLAGTMQLFWGARSSRPLPSASRRRAVHNHLVTPFSEWILPPHLFGETPNRATETVALPFSNCIGLRGERSALLEASGPPDFTVSRSIGRVGIRR